jgi:hypothetical protein
LPFTASDPVIRELRALHGRLKDEPNNLPLALRLARGYLELGRVTGGMNKGRLTSLVRLSYLAPDIVRAFLAGHQPIALTPIALLRLSKDLPHDWSEQRYVLGFAA